MAAVTSAFQAQRRRRCARRPRFADRALAQLPWISRGGSPAMTCCRAFARSRCVTAKKSSKRPSIRSHEGKVANLQQIAAHRRLRRQPFDFGEGPAMALSRRWLSAAETGSSILAATPAKRLAESHGRYGAALHDRCRARSAQRTKPSSGHPAFREPYATATRSRTRRSGLGRVAGLVREFPGSPFQLQPNPNGLDFVQLQ
jgi:hypothetical protein